MANMYSDGQGTLIYVEKSKDDDNFVSIKIEE